MTDQKSITRRRLLGAGAALPLGLLAGRSGAEASCASTPRQTSGPFYPLFEQTDKDVDLTRMVGHDASAAGAVIRVTGSVLDQNCRPVAGALVDLWQADHHGRYRHPADPNPAQPDPNFQGWGQAVTDADGRYAFRTIKPAAYPLEFLDGKPAPEAGFRTPHIHFRVSKRGYRELVTQMYFAGEALNERDIVLARVPVDERHRVVVTPARAAGEDAPVYGFDLALMAV